MRRSPSISNKYWETTTVLVVSDMITLPVVDQKVLTSEKIIRRWHTKNLELPNLWVAINICQGILLWHGHCFTFWIFLTINMEADISECSLHGIYIANGLVSKVRNNCVIMDMFQTILALFND